MVTTTPMRMPGSARPPALQAHDDAQGQQADAQGAEVGLVEVGDELAEVHQHVAAVDAEAEELGQLADDDDDRQAGHVAEPDRLREQVGDEAEPGDAGADGDGAHQQRQHPRQSHGSLHRACGQRQDDGRDDGAQRRVRAQHQVRRRPERGIGHQAHDRRVQAGDGGQAGQLGIGHALRHQQRREHDGGDQVAAQPLPRS